VQHVLISCVFAREVWSQIFQGLCLLVVALQSSEVCFTSWWFKAIHGATKGSELSNQFGGVGDLEAPK
jgi:hypothetical protein